MESDNRQSSPASPPSHYWDAVAVHFSEIALKGGNRRSFTQRLRNNLSAALTRYDAAVRAYHEKLLIDCPRDEVPRILKAAAAVFGVAYAAPVRTLRRDIQELIRAAVDYFHASASPGTTFAIRAHRSDKKFPHTSREIAELAGAAVCRAGGTVDLNNPALPIILRIFPEAAYLEGPHTPGPGGLPLGATGRVLSLFSGGIDSPVAAWLIMRRGCRADFIHFHTYPTGEAAQTSKIPQMVKSLVQPQGLPARLFLTPYHHFQGALLQHRIPQNYELILFRRFMMRIAARIASEHDAVALVTGDNLAQVASQTTSNLIACDQAATLPVWRPLLAFNKEEIIARAVAIGTYESSIEAYKDCCSLVSRHPLTRPRLETVLHLEQRLPLDEMTAGTLDDTTLLKIEP